ncbi:hypothetical protein EPO33_03755 [Patescibacteria group bacterium]|nr:MAG: hypothetical protein EPO33_03755 [Patescibacteria group bacterium]
MGDDNKTLPPGRSAQFMLKELLKGDPQTTFPRILNAKAVEKEMEMVRLLIEPGAFWIVSCATVEQVAPDAPEALWNAFREFAGKGGAKIVVATKNAYVAACMRAAAKDARNVDLRVVAEYKDALALRKAHDEKRPKKQT